MKRGLFSADEAEAMLACAQSGPVADNAVGKVDASGVESKICIWNTPGVNIWGGPSAHAMCPRHIS